MRRDPLQARDFWAVGLISLLGLALRLQGLGEADLWLDEATSYWIARRPVSEILPTLEVVSNSPPLFLVLQSLALRWSDSEIGVRLVSFLAGSALVPVAFFATWRLTGSRAASHGCALLVAVSGFLVFYSQDGRMYALFALVSAVSMAAFYVALSSLRWRDGIASAVAGFAVLSTHYFGVFLLLGQALWALASMIGPRGRPWQKVVRVGAPHATMVLLYAAWILPGANLHSAPIENTGNPPLLSAEYASRLAQIYTAGGATSVLYPLMGLVGFAWLLRRSRGAALYLVTLIATGWIGVLLFLEDRSFWAARYYIFLFPALLPLVAAGFVACADRVHAGLERWLGPGRPPRAAIVAACLLVPLVLGWNDVQLLRDRNHRSVTRPRYETSRLVRVLDREVGRRGRGAMLATPFWAIQPFAYYYGDRGPLDYLTFDEADRVYQTYMPIEIAVLPTADPSRLLDYDWVISYDAGSHRRDHADALEEMLERHFSLRREIVNPRARRRFRIFVREPGSPEPGEASSAPRAP